jgi:quinol monooxygenase YgiN
VIHIVWIFEALPDRLADFEKAYGVNGQWVQLFRRGEGYVETDLLRDSQRPNRFLVLDKWRDLASFESFKRHYQAAYDELDRQCEELTLVETKIGAFSS